jgi:chromosome partitioning protein
MVTLALYNLKGGVGKTAATINLAYLAAKEGYKTLIWDMDPQGSSSFYLGAKSAAKNESRKLLNSEMELLDAVQILPMRTLISFLPIFRHVMQMFC